MEPDDAQEAFQIKLERLKFYRAEIQHEFNLLANRVSSYITSQSFLVIGFAMSMGNMNPQWGDVFRLIVPIALTLMGLTTSILVWPGIKGATSTIGLWRDKQGKLLADDARFDAYHVERVIVRSRQGRTVDRIHERSLLFALWSPWVFMVAWTAFGALAWVLYAHSKRM